MLRGECHYIWRSSRAGCGRKTQESGGTLRAHESAFWPKLSWTRVLHQINEVASLSVRVCLPSPASDKVVHESFCRKIY